MHHRISFRNCEWKKNIKSAFSETEIFDLIKNFKYIIPKGSQ